MTLMKAPKLNKNHVLTLRALVRIDYSRAVRHVIATEPVADEAAKKILKLTHVLTDAEQPLMLTQTMMETHQAPEAWLPINQARVDFLMGVLNKELTERDLADLIVVANLPPGEERNIETLRVFQRELIHIFEHAEMIDPATFAQELNGELEESPSSRLLN